MPSSEVRDNIIQILRKAKQPMSIKEIRDAGRKLGLFVGANSGVTGNAFRITGTRKIKPEFTYNPRTHKYGLRALGEKDEGEAPGWTKSKKITGPPKFQDYPLEGLAWHDKEKQLTGRLFISNIPDYRAEAPTVGGIYFLHNNEGRVIYVGESESYADTHGIRGRIQFHHNPSAPHKGQKVNFSFFSYLEVPRNLILPFEEFLIKVFRPKKNIIYT